MADRTTQNILTTIGNSSRDTELQINWEGLTRDDLIRLAARAVIPAIQRGYIRDKSAPEKDFVDAQWYLDNDFAKPKKLGRIKDLPKHLLGKPSKDERLPNKPATADDILAGMSAADRKALLSLLQG